MVEKGSVIARGETAGLLRVVDDQRGAATWTHSLALTIAEMLQRRAPSGVYHVTDAGETTWYGLARETLRLAGLAEVPVEPVTSEEFPRPAPRPRYSVPNRTRVEAVVGPMPECREGDFGGAVPDRIIDNSDQGTQHTVARVRPALQGSRRASLIGSRGDCYDNVLCESFFATLECELLDGRRAGPGGGADSRGRAVASMKQADSQERLLLTPAPF